MLSFLAKVWAVTAAIWFPFLLWIYGGESLIEMLQEAGLPTIGLFLTGVFFVIAFEK